MATPSRRLYAAGTAQPGYERVVAAWDGSDWEAVGVIEPQQPFGFVRVHDIAVLAQPPADDRVFLAGEFGFINAVPVRGVAEWADGRWLPLGSAFTAGGGYFGTTRSPVLALHDPDGGGAEPASLFVGGSFKSVDYKPIAHFARWACGVPRRCEADCDPATGLGVLDFFDFLCFQRQFDAGDPYACDCDTFTGIGVCDVFDYLCYQRLFVAGCR